RVRESGAFGVGNGPRRQCQVQTGCGCRLGHVPPGRILVIGTREDLTIVPETRDLLRSKTNEVGSDVLTAPVGVPSARACAGAVRTPRPTSQPKLKVRPDYFDAGGLDDCTREKEGTLLKKEAPRQFPPAGEEGQRLKRDRILHNRDD